jgi:hypothetical protein
MDQVGTPFSWSILAVIAIAVAAAMIIYSIYAVRKKDEPDPSFSEVSGTQKQDWTRTGKIDFRLPHSEVHHLSS